MTNPTNWYELQHTLNNRAKSKALNKKIRPNKENKIMNADTPEMQKLKLETQKMLADMEHDLSQRYHWDEQRAHWKRQQYYWIGIVIMGVVAVIFNALVKGKML